MTRSKRQAPWAFMSFLVNLIVSITRLVVLLAQDCDQP
jgi:hypothetical protein